MTGCGCEIRNTSAPETMESHVFSPVESLLLERPRIVRSKTLTFSKERHCHYSSNNPGDADDHGFRRNGKPCSHGIHGHDTMAQQRICDRDSYVQQCGYHFLTEPSVRFY